MNLDRFGGPASWDSHHAAQELEEMGKALLEAVAGYHGADPTEKSIERRFSKDSDVYVYWHPMRAAVRFSISIDHSEHYSSEMKGSWIEYEECAAKADDDGGIELLIHAEIRREIDFLQSQRAELEGAP